MFGRPEQLIKSQIHKVRSLPSVNESDLTSLINFANKVSNMTTFLESVDGTYHLANPLLLSELLSKLPWSRSRFHSTGATASTRTSLTQ